MSVTLGLIITNNFNYEVIPFHKCSILEITVIGIIDLGGVTSAFGCYLYSTMKVDNIG